MNILKGLLILFVLSFLGMPSYAQKNKKKQEEIMALMETDSLMKYESELLKVGAEMLDGYYQSDRIKALMRFIPLLVKTLKFEGSIYYPFDSLAFMKKLSPEDGSFRLYNWALKYDDGSFRFYGAIQMNNPDSFQLIPLRDYSDKLDKLDTGVLDTMILDKDTWYGALYSDVIFRKHRKNRYYTLIGWDGYGAFSNRKILEVLTLKNGIAKFGAPVFNVHGEIKSRVVFEFREDATMLLNYLPEHGIITFDNMVPPNEQGKGQYHTYAPDGSYNYMKFKRGKWVWIDDLFKNFKKTIREAGDIGN